MNRVFKISLILILATTIFGDARYALAQEKKDCMENAYTNYDFAVCAGSKIEQQEKVLKEVWQCVTTKYPDKQSDGYKALLTEQAAWEKFKEVACRLYEYDFGREGQTLQLGSCIASIIKQRIAYLNTVLYPSNDEKCMEVSQ